MRWGPEDPEGAPRGSRGARASTTSRAARMTTFADARPRIGRAPLARAPQAKARLARTRVVQGWLAMARVAQVWLARASRASAARAPTLGLGELAALVHRLAVLLGAGVAPISAWQHATGPPFEAVGADVAAAAARAGAGAIPDAVAARVRTPGAVRAMRASGPDRHPARDRRRARAPTPRAIDAAWTGLAAAWAVADTAGASLAPTLRAYAGLLRGLAAAEREARVALAGPRATARLVLVLPVIAIAFGALLGQDTIGVLVGTPIGWACLGIGALLGLGGWAWTRRLLRRASAVDGLPGLVEELTAVAMSAGVSVDRARRVVDAALLRYGIDDGRDAGRAGGRDAGRAGVRAGVRAGGRDGGHNGSLNGGHNAGRDGGHSGGSTGGRAGVRDGADAALRLASASGAPAGELLRAEAEERRQSAVAEARERAERLAIALMLPLGVCVLPAFVAVGVVPLMVSVVSSTIAGI